MCGSVLNPWDNGGIHGISRRTPLCSESCACWAERTILLNLSKSSGLWDSCRGFTAQVVLTLPTQRDFGLIPGPYLQSQGVEHVTGQEPRVCRDHQPCWAGPGALALPLHGCSARDTHFPSLAALGTLKACEAPWSWGSQPLLRFNSPSQEYLRLSVWGQSPKVHQVFLMISFIAKKPPKNVLVISKEPSQTMEMFFVVWNLRNLEIFFFLTRNS